MIMEPNKKDKLRDLGKGFEIGTDEDYGCFGEDY